jgi:hypothetical protein
MDRDEPRGDNVLVLDPEPQESADAVDASADLVDT